MLFYLMHAKIHIFYIHIGTLTPKCVVLLGGVMKKGEDKNTGYARILTFSHAHLHRYLLQIELHTMLFSIKLY